MPSFQNPGAFFLGTLVAAEQKFLKPLLENARGGGYKRFAEPCAGAFAMAHLAVQAGYGPAQIEASDVSMFSAVMGHAITGQPLDGLGIRARGFAQEELLDPATALYAWIYLRAARQAGKEYYHNIMRDLEYRKDAHVKAIREQLERASGLLRGMSYRTMDMWRHLEECYGDPGAIVIANPPTYASGFERWYDTGGAMTWKEPEYGVFDPATGLRDLYGKMSGAKCLLICYEENEPGKTAGAPVFARYGVRAGVNVYLTSNRPDEAAALARGKRIARPNESALVPLGCGMLPRDYVIGREAGVQVARIEQPEAQYYRKLWTHGFTGAAAPCNFAVLIDGKVAGVFGIDKAALTIGAFGARVSDAAFLMYGMAAPHATYRLGRLVTMLAQNRGFIDGICDDLERAKVKSLKTVQMTRYPEAKEMRGIMRLAAKKPDHRHGFRLTYESKLFDRTEEETLAEWLWREERWQAKRAKTGRLTK